MASGTHADMTGKTVLITGATNGIGRAAAIELAKMGAEQVLVCRSRQRGEETCAMIRGAVPHAQTALIIADLSELAQVRRAADEFLASGRPLHVLINNAGVFNLKRALTADGLEATFAINHLACFTLTMRLLERLRASAPARVVNVASDAHRHATLKFDDLMGERGYGMIQAYGQSKLANILFTRELARRLEGSGVRVNAVHPGAVRTGLGQNNDSTLGKLAITGLGLFFRSPAKGAETVVYLASSPEVEKLTGKYFMDRREHRYSAEAGDDSAARRLFEVSAELTGAELPSN